MTNRAIRELAAFAAFVVAAFVVRNAVVLTGLSALALVALGGV
jgi:hypothetical protein